MSAGGPPDILAGMLMFIAVQKLRVLKRTTLARLIIYPMLAGGVVLNLYVANSDFYHCMQVMGPQYPEITRGICDCLLYTSDAADE